MEQLQVLQAGALRLQRRRPAAKTRQQSCHGTRQCQNTLVHLVVKMRCRRVEFMHVWHVHIAQVLLEALNAQPRRRILSSPPLSAVVHAAALRLLLGRQAQMPCDRTNLPTRVAVVEAVGVTRVTARHVHNEARRLARK